MPLVKLVDVNNKMLKIETITVGAFAMNSYLLYDENSKSAVFIDPGMDHVHSDYSYRIFLLFDRSFLLNDFSRKNITNSKP